MKRLRFLAVVVLYVVLPASIPRVEAHNDAAVSLKQDMRKLWTDHVVWTREYIVAAVVGQPDAQAAANRLMKNQEDIGNAIGKIYGAPAGQQLTTLVDMMKGHLTTTTNEVVARLNKNWDADVRAFDEVYHHILMMSDALTDGIVKQFPNRFDAGPTATSGAE